MLTSNFVALAVDGRRLSRAEYLNAEFGKERQGGPAVETEVRDFAATRTGSALVLSYQETERSAVGDQTFAVHLGRLDVYVLQGGRWLLQAMTAVRLPDAPNTIEVSTESLAECVGVYEFAPGILSTVRLVDGHLLEQSTGNPEGELLPIGPDEFYAPPDLEARVAFERDASGRVVAQVYRSGSQVLRARRIRD